MTFNEKKAGEKETLQDIGKGTRVPYHLNINMKLIAFS